MTYMYLLHKVLEIWTFRCLKVVYLDLVIPVMIFFKLKTADQSLHKFFRIFTHRLRTIDSTFINWFLKYRKTFLDIVTNIKPDVIITSTVSIAPAMFGYCAKKRDPQLIWINDLRDSMSLFNEAEKSPISRIIDRKIDKLVLQKTDIIITVSNTLRDIFKGFYNKPVYTIYNGFKEEESKYEKVSNDIPVLYYAGRIYPHREQAFKLLLNTILDLNVRLVVRLVGSQDQFNNYIEFLQQRSQKNVEILEPVDHLTVEREENLADMLILLEDLDDRNIISKGTLTGKLFEYLNIPNQILAICRKDSEIGEVLKNSEKGIIATTSEEIVDFITNLQQFGSHSPDRIKILNYSRKTQADRVKDILNGYNEN